MNKNLITAAVLTFTITGALTAQGITASMRPFVNIRNNTGTTITELYITSADISDWGANKISKPLTNGMPAQFTLEKTLGEVRIYDFCLKDGKGGSWAKYGVDVKALTTLVFTKSDEEKTKPAGAAGSGTSSGSTTSTTVISPAQTAGARKKIVESAYKYIGARYILGNQKPPSSFDCSGLVSQAYKDALGIKIPRTSREMYAQGIKIDKSKAQPGDVIVMDTENAGFPTHVALYVDDKTTVQALSAIRPPSVVERGNPGLNKCKVLGYRTFVGWKQGNKANYQPVGSTDFLFTITGTLSKTTEELEVEANSTMRFIFTNKTGAAGSFAYNFYRVGDNESSGDGETFTLKEGAAYSSALCLPKKAGRYKLEVTCNSRTVMEKIWTVRN